jgi:hypothetical protein
MVLCHSQVTLMKSTDNNITETTYFNMNLVISKCVTAVKVSNFTAHYLSNRSTLDIGVLVLFFSIVLHTEHPPEVWSLLPVTLCIYIYGYTGLLKFCVHLVITVQKQSKIF